jgi:hypothetical protein
MKRKDLRSRRFSSCQAAGYRGTLWHKQGPKRPACATAMNRLGFRASSYALRFASNDDVDPAFYRFQAPSTLSYRERNPNADGRTFVPTPPLSGRSSPYQPYGSALGGHASTSSNSLHSLGVGSNGRDSLPRWQSHRSDELLESQNDEHIEGIGAKVKQLKAVSSSCLSTGLQQRV